MPDTGCGLTSQTRPPGSRSSGRPESKTTPSPAARTDASASVISIRTPRRGEVTALFSILTRTQNGQARVIRLTLILEQAVDLVVRTRDELLPA